MPDFFKDFLNQEVTALSRNSPPVAHLAAFGKHPAWNDHMEDIGLSTLTLLEAKRYLYLQGISGQIDSGAWNPPPATTSSIPQFNHWLLWHRPGEMLLGRLLASTDGKGRTRYPFIVLAHIVNLPLAAALQTCAPVIDETARHARAAATPESVRQILQQNRARLATTVVNTPDNFSPLPPGLRPAIDPAGWTRLYHVLENQLHQYGPGARPEHPACRHLRLPAATNHPLASLLWWTAYWLTQLDPKFPLLLIAPETETLNPELRTQNSELRSPNWLDAIIGEPASQHFRCLLADTATIPSVTDTPYNPAQHITQVTSELLAGSDSNLLPARSLFHLKPPTRDTALATLSTRAGLAAAARPAGLFKKLFG